MDRIFLGGTCANTTWRNDLVKILPDYGCEWFNPVVEDWTPECQAIEEDEKNNKCNIHLYVITPEMVGVYSIAEIINSCWQAQLYGTCVNKVAFFILGDSWSEAQRKSFRATLDLCSNIAPARFCGGFAMNVKEICGIMDMKGFIGKDWFDLNK